MMPQHKPLRLTRGALSFGGLLASLCLGTAWVGAGAAWAEPPAIEWAHDADGVPIPQQCLTANQIVCSDKSRAIATLYEAGNPALTFQVRYGDARGPAFATGEGHGVIARQSRDHISSIYGTPMPYSNFIAWDNNPIKGQAFHFSQEFAVEGYAGASHGCMNIADEAAAADLFNRVHVGTEVFVYRSESASVGAAPTVPAPQQPAAPEPEPEAPAVDRPAPPVTPEAAERVPVPAIGATVDPLSRLAAVLRAG